MPAWAGVGPQANRPKLFEFDAAIPFDLARYYCGLGQVREAKKWLGKALLVAKDLEEVQRLRKLLSKYLGAVS